MQRRDLLRVLAGAAAVPALAGLPSERLLALGTENRPAPGTTPRALDPHQFATVSAVAELILPATDTPGALDAGVPEFVDLLLAEWYADEDRAHFLAGLDALDARAQAMAGGAFVALTPTAQTALLQQLDGARGDPGSAEWLFRHLKSLTLYGYFTSQPVMVDVLKVPIWPGRFDGCTPVARS